MIDERVPAAFRAWLEARDSRILGKTQPHRVRPGTGGPFLVYHFHGFKQFVANITNQPAGFHTGLSQTMLDIEIWDKNYSLCAAISHRINGQKSNVGLAGFQDYMPFPAVGAFPAGNLAVNAVFLIDSDTFFEVDGDRQETGWSACWSQYRITYQEL